jgi:hypothetical protein
MSTPTAFPLQWPHGWPTTSYRESSRFNTTLASGLDQLKKDRSLAKKNHPDVGGSAQAMAEINGALADAKLARGWK